MQLARGIMPRSTHLLNRKICCQNCSHAFFIMNGGQVYTCKLYKVKR